MLNLSSRDDEIAIGTIALDGRSPEQQRRILDLAFCYGDVLILEDIISPQLRFFHVHQHPNAEHPTDMAWVCNALARIEPGWKMIDGVLHSPARSTTSDRTIAETIINGREYYSPSPSPSPSSFLLPPFTFPLPPSSCRLLPFPNC